METGDTDYHHHPHRRYHDLWCHFVYVNKEGASHPLC